MSLRRLRGNPPAANANRWAARPQRSNQVSKSNGMYYTPKEIIDPAAGTGNYLNVAAELLSNPPYAAQQSVQRR